MSLFQLGEFRLNSGIVSPYINGATKKGLVENEAQNRLRNAVSWRLQPFGCVLMPGTTLSSLPMQMQSNPIDVL